MSRGYKDDFERVMEECNTLKDQRDAARGVADAGFERAMKLCETDGFVGYGLGMLEAFKHILIQCYGVEFPDADKGVVCPDGRAETVYREDK